MRGFQFFAHGFVGGVTAAGQHCVTRIEAQLGTNPNLADSDGDGFSDGDEVEAETDPLSASDIPQSGGLSISLIKAALDGREP